MFSAHHIYWDNVKIEFLEDKLFTKSTHYEWLSEITNSLMNGDNGNFQENIDKIKEFNENQKNITSRPNSDTICGEGTEERSDGRCYPKLLNNI